MSGLEAASNIAAQPPWQLPTMMGFGASECLAITSRTKWASAAHTSVRV